MGIFDRMGKVISSNVNAMLDRAEDDEKLLELNLDEMAEQIKGGRAEVVAAVASEKQLRKKHEDLLAEAAKWDKRAELAVKAGDESLAREALKHKKRVGAEAAAADQARTEQRDQALKMKSELDRMEKKLDELKMRKGTILARARQAKGAEGLGSKGSGPSAFDNFRRMEERIETKEAEGSAMQEVEDALHDGSPPGDLEAKFRELERSSGATGGGAKADPDIEDELAALKKRVRIG